MFGLGVLLIALSPAVRASELRPPVAAPMAVETAAWVARAAGRRPTPAVFPRRGTRSAASVSGDRSAVSGPLANSIDPRRRQDALRLAVTAGPLARGRDARAQRGPPLRFR